MKGPIQLSKSPFIADSAVVFPLPELKDVNMLLLQASAAAAAAVANPADAACAAEAARLKAACEKSALQLGYSVDDVMECQDCKLCGWAACMPVCPIEWDETKPATMKAYVPVLQSNGVSVQSELQEQTTTRKGLMQHMEAAFAVADAHLFIDEWTTHHRQLVYSFMGLDAIIIQTDFSAQYAHKAACTNTCEHPPTSNMDVFVVTTTRVVFDAAECSPRCQL